jgi:cell division septum initiation protein DivIVA
MKCKYIFLLIAVLVSAIGFAQTDSIESPNDLEAQYLELKDESNNYQIYKVVKEVSMDNFWNSVEDSLAGYNKEISDLKKEVSGLNTEVSGLQLQLSERDAQIEDQNSQIENMNFLGMAISKGSYVAMTWTIIFILIGLALVLFMRFNNANKVTVQTRQEHEKLIEEFELHRQRARETETKIKRDLQTELNRVEELKQKMGES